MITSETVLASASPRRRRLIGWLGLDARMLATDTVEDLTRPMPPASLAVSLAAGKAVAARAAGARGTILAFDTIVIREGRVLGKPVDTDDARRMLESLSGDTHDVVTGVALYAETMAAPYTFPVTTPVRMRALDAGDIETWIAGGEALGCAGAYNIEHHLASVDDDQCFQNVAGLPLCHVYRALASGGSGDLAGDLLRPVEQCDAALGRHCLLGPVICADIPSPGTR